MITTYYEYITESKNYPLFRYLSDSGLNDLLKIGYLREADSEMWTYIRKEVLDVDYAISVTRSFEYVKRSSCFVEFNTPKLTSMFKVIPFSENPDYHIYKLDQPESSSSSKKNLRNTSKEDNKEFWKIKTDKNHDDYGISEEIVIAKKIPISCIKTLYISGGLYKANEEKIKELNIPVSVFDDRGELTSYYKTQKRYSDFVKNKKKVLV